MSDDQGTDWQKRYKDAQAELTRLQQAAKENAEAINALTNDPLYAPARQAIKLIEDGKEVRFAESEPKEEPKQAKAEKLLSRLAQELSLPEDQLRQGIGFSVAERDTKYQNWLSEIEAKEKALGNRFPELAESGVFGKSGKIAAEMQRYGIQDWEKGARMVLEPKYFMPAADAESTVSRPPPSHAPHGGEPPGTRAEEQPETWEQATSEHSDNFASFLNDPRVKGR